MPNGTLDFSQIPLSLWRITLFCFSQVKVMFHEWCFQVLLMFQKDSGDTFVKGCSAWCLPFERRFGK